MCVPPGVICAGRGLDGRPARAWVHQTACVARCRDQRRPSRARPTGYVRAARAGTSPGHESRDSTLTDLKNLLVPPTRADVPASRTPAEHASSDGADAFSSRRGDRGGETLYRLRGVDPSWPAGRPLGGPRACLVPGLFIGLCSSKGEEWWVRGLEIGIVKPQIERIYAASPSGNERARRCKVSSQMLHITVSKLNVAPNTPGQRVHTSTAAQTAKPTSGKPQFLAPRTGYACSCGHRDNDVMATDRTPPVS